MAKVDWGFTEDGDLALGEPLTDDTGATLYRHFDGTVDTEMGSDGKLIRDIYVAEGLDVDKQIIMNRLQTDSPDWFHHPQMGGNLSDLIGEPNTRETAQRGVNYIMNALTYRGLYNPTQVMVRPVPIGQHQLLFFIEITKLRDDIVRLPLLFNLEHGMLSIYETPKS